MISIFICNWIYLEQDDPYECCWLFGIKLPMLISKTGNFYIQSKMHKAYNPTNSPWWNKCDKKLPAEVAWKPFMHTLHPLFHIYKKKDIDFDISLLLLCQCKWINNKYHSENDRKGYKTAIIHYKLSSSNEMQSL